ncbi:MAG: hypothetical protein JWM72_2751 [Actinomycetia bacterium]|nr:hypothetical protein [Actinomycetes bacterium]
MTATGGPFHQGRKSSSDAYFIKISKPAGSGLRSTRPHLPRKGPARTLTIIATIAMLLPALVFTGSLLQIGTHDSNAATTIVTALGNQRPAIASARDYGSVELGLKFKPDVDGYIVGVRFYKGAGNKGPHTGTLWSAKGQNLARVTFTGESASGWQTASFQHRVAVQANKVYVVSYHAPVGHYSYTRWYFNHGHDNGYIRMNSSRRARGNGVYAYSNAPTYPTYTWTDSNYFVDVMFTTSAAVTPPTDSGKEPPTTDKPTPTTDKATTTTVPKTTTTGAPTTTTDPPVVIPPPTTTTRPPVVTPPPTTNGAFPSAANTGVPGGTNLTTYTGPTTIRSCGVVIDSKVVNGDLTILAGNGTHSASTPCVTIKNSLVRGVIDDKYAGYSCGGVQGCGPLVITDSEVAVPVPADVAAVSDANYYMWRSYVHGARSGAQCDGYCEIHDSFLLADKEFGTAHMDAFITNGNYGAPIVLDHNAFLCAPTGAVPNGSGCAADVGLFGDFSAVTNMTITDNLFKATNDAYFCLHSGYEPGKPYPNGGGLNYTNNVFERGANGKCGVADAVFNWYNSAGRWCNNMYDDGATVLASDQCP